MWAVSVICLKYCWKRCRTPFNQLIWMTLRKIAFENLLGKRKTMLVISVFSFSRNSFFSMRDKLNVLKNIWHLEMHSIWSRMKCCRTITDTLDFVEITGFGFNLFPNKPWFLRVCITSLLKTLGKGEIARNEQFLLFPQCFLPIWRTFCHFHKI